MNEVTTQMQRLSRRITYLLDIEGGFATDEIMDLMDQYNHLGQVKRNLQEGKANV